MERLTKFDYENYRALKPKQDVVDKLGELEDVLEKYGIETTEELDGMLKPLIDNGELENWKSATFWKMQTERLAQELADLQHRLEVAERTTKLACEEMDDSGCVAICNYCPYNLQEICPNECPQSVILLEKYFKEQAEKEVKGEKNE